MTNPNISSHQKYTPDGLPVVTRETFRLFVELLNREQKAVISDTDATFEQLLKCENPVFYDALHALLPVYNDDEARGFVKGMQFTYEQLRRQMSAYRLDDQMIPFDRR